MDWIFWAGAAAGGFLIGALGFFVWAVVRAGDVALEAEDWPVQNDFGASMDRFGYVQDARNREE